METEIIDSREIIYSGDYDVIVAGGGISGVSAAVAASRTGAKTLLLEKNIVLGGLATAGLISWYEPLCDGHGKKMISGIAEELIRLSIKYGFDDLPDVWRDGKNETAVRKRYSTHFSPTLFAMALDEYLAENNVTVRFDSLAIFPVMREKHCEGIMAESKTGREFYAAKAVVDATGDAQIIYNAGMPTVTGENYLSYVAHGTSVNLAKKLADDGNMAAFRKWAWVGSDMLGNGHPTNMKKFTGVTAEEITEFVLTGRKMLFETLKKDDRNVRDITMIPFMPQFRTIRRLDGANTFKAVDGETFKDSIGTCGDFRYGGQGRHYEIPLSCLYHKDYDNIFAVGRIISAEGDGWEVARVIPVCALTGQAAGEAAAKLK